MKLILRPSHLRGLAVVVVALFLVWNVAALVLALGRMNRTAEVTLLGDRLEAFTRGASAELAALREINPAGGAAAPMDRLLRLWNEHARAISGMKVPPAVQPRLRRALESMSLAWEARSRISTPLAAAERRLAELEFRANAAYAGLEVRTALAEVRSAPLGSLEAEQRRRIGDLVLSLAFGLSVLGAILYMKPGRQGAGQPDSPKPVEAEAERKPEPAAGPDPREAVRSVVAGFVESFDHHVTTINGYSDLLLGSLPAKDPNRDDLEQIRRAGERAAAMTGQLFWFSRRDAQTELARFELNKLVLALEPRLRSMAADNIVLAFNTNEDTGVIDGDPGQVGQAVISLVLNAQEAMPEGGKLRIETAPVYTEDRGWWSTVAVIDSGAGIDAGVRERLFQPFFSTKLGGRGAGIGLTVVEDIVRRHRAVVDVMSEPGRGSTFRIYFPRVDESRFPPPKPVVEEAAGG